MTDGIEVDLTPAAPPQDTVEELYRKWCSVCQMFVRARPEDDTCPVCGLMFRSNKCMRCGHEWIQRTRHAPGTCPKCRNPYWNRIYVKPEQSRKKRLDHV